MILTILKLMYLSNMPLVTSKGNSCRVCVYPAASSYMSPLPSNDVEQPVHVISLDSSEKSSDSAALTETHNHPDRGSCTAAVQDAVHGGLTLVMVS